MRHLLLKKVVKWCTYIERDVKELSDAIDSLKFLRFITTVAARCGQMVNVAEIARDADINQTQAIMDFRSLSLCK